MSESEIRIIEPKLKIWVSRERTVQIAEYQPEKIIIGISEAIDEELTAEQKISRLKDLADMVENELNARVERLTEEKTKPPIAPKTPSKAPDVKDYPEYKICANCGESVERKESQFKRDDGKPFYYRCPECKGYMME